MNAQKLAPGTYRTLDAVTIALFCGNQQKEYTTYGPGREFTVPKHVNNYWTAAIYYPDFGDSEPRLDLVSTQ